MDLDKYNRLENKISKLESKKNITLWLQFFIFPLILAAMGYYFQSTIKSSEKRMEQLKVSQNIIQQVFQDTIYAKTIAMRGILYEVLDNDRLSEQLGEIIDKRLENLVINGSPKDFVKVTEAVNLFSSDKDSIRKKFNTSRKVQKAIAAKEKLANEKEVEAFNYLKNGNLLKAEFAFKQLDSIYPTYHQAYEINKYLKENRKNFNDSMKIEQIKLYTVVNYNYGAPKKIIEEIKSSSKILSAQK